MDNNTEHLDAIIGIPVNSSDSDNVKCESDITSIKNDNGTNGGTGSNTGGSGVKGETTTESDCCESDSDSLGVHEQNEPCTMQPFNTIDHRDSIETSRLEVTDIR